MPSTTRAAAADAVTHRRRILFVKPRFWIVVDDLLGTSRHQINLTFQFAPMKVTLGPNRWARAQTPGGHALWVGSVHVGAGPHVAQMWRAATHPRVDRARLRRPRGRPDLDLLDDGDAAVARADAASP